MEFSLRAMKHLISKIICQRRLVDIVIVLLIGFIVLFAGFNMLTTFLFPIENKVEFARTPITFKQNLEFQRTQDIPTDRTTKNVIFQTRKNHIIDYCKTLNTNGTKPKISDNLTQFPHPRQFLVLKEKQLVWCPVYKASSSTWMTFLAHLSNRSNKNDLLKKYGGIALGHEVAPELSLASFNAWLNQIHHENGHEIKLLIGQVSR